MAINLVEIIGESETLVAAFKTLKNAEILIEPNLGSSYHTISARKEFVILEDFGGNHKQLLHPYGTSMGYWVNSVAPEKDSPSTS